MHFKSVALRNRALLLGYLGLLPLLAGAVLLIADTRQDLAIQGIQNYGAIILTFVGAIHWGRAMNTVSVRLLTVSVLPSLLAWACLFLPPSAGLPLLAAAFLAVLLHDGREYEDLAWFRRLRMHLTFGVSTLLVAAWAAV